MKIDKKKALEKWSSVIESLNAEKKGWFEEYSQYYHSNEINIAGNVPIYSGETTSLSANTFPSLLPMAMKISAQTIGMGGTRKSEEQQLREDRANKIRQIEGDEPNIVLPDDEDVPGLVSVQPLSAPSGLLMYIDYKYGDIKYTRKQKLEQIERNQKILEILEMLKNNI